MKCALTAYVGRAVHYGKSSLYVLHYHDIRLLRNYMYHEEKNSSFMLRLEKIGNDLTAQRICFIKEMHWSQHVHPCMSVCLSYTILVLFRCVYTIWLVTLSSVPSWLSDWDRTVCIELLTTRFWHGGVSQEKKGKVFASASYATNHDL